MVKEQKPWWKRMCCRHDWTPVTRPRLIGRKQYMVLYGYTRRCDKCYQIERHTDYYEEW